MVVFRFILVFVLFSTSMCAPSENTIDVETVTSTLDDEEQNHDEIVSRNETTNLKDISAVPDEDRIIGGAPALVFEYPFMVSLQRIPKGENSLRKDASNKFCGGSILDAQWVLSAAHCFKSTDPEVIENYYAHAGVNNAFDYTGTSQLVRIKQVFKHEFYDVDTHSNDICLLKLAEPFNITNAVWPLFLPSVNHDPMKSGYGVIMGWGAVDPIDHTISYGILKKTFQDIMSEAICLNFWSITHRQICLYDKKHPSGDCSGDSGGPFIQYINRDPTVIGITSYGDKECGVAPSVYTRVSSYLKWINSTRTNNS